MRAFFLLITLALTLSFSAAGCHALHGPANVQHPRPVGHTPEYTPVYIEKAFTQSEHDAIHRALAGWNYVLNGYQVYSVASDDFDYDLDVIEQISNTDQGLVFVRASIAMADSLDLSDGILVEKENNGVLAWVPGLGEQVVFIVTDRIGTRDLTAITEHEIGHTLGIPHLPIKGTMLYPYYTFGASCIDRATVQALASLSRGRFDWHFMNWCELPL